jgi:predicted nucleotidyltransferase
LGTIARAQNPNIQILELAVDRLGELTNELVFLGGCATGLLLTDPAAPPIRATQDVDVITEVATLAEYHRLSARLRQKGFAEDQSPDAPICRWVAPGVVLDVMPTNEEILGFGNVWYEPALVAAQAFELPSGVSIRMVTAPHFLATKLAAFDNRGRGDFMKSHDMEDMVAVLDGRPELMQDLLQANEDLRTYLASRFGELLADEDFLAALPGHLQGGTASPDRTPVVIRRLEEIAKLT